MTIMITFQLSLSSSIEVWSTGIGSI